MSVRFYADELRCAIYEEAPGGGDPVDPNSQMNRPIISPLSWLPNIFFHTDLDYYGVTHSNLSVSITHPIVPGKTFNLGVNGLNVPTIQYVGNIASSDHLLLTHNLGYVPKFFAIYDGKFVPNGYAVQRENNTRFRFACVYATTTQIRVYTVGLADASDLAAITVNYGAIVFRRSAPIAGEQMLRIAPGDVVFGQGKFNGGQPHLRVVGPGDAQYAVAQGRTSDIRNGAFRVYLPNGGFLDLGSYTGSLSTPPFINVTAGV